MCFNDKRVVFRDVTAANHYFLSEIKCKSIDSSTFFPKFIIGFSFDVERLCLKIM